MRPFDDLELRESGTDTSWTLRYPPDLRTALRQGPGAWQMAVLLAIRHGIRDPDELTDMAFFMHFPELGGQKVPAGHPRMATFRSAWTRLRTEIRGLLGSGPAPSGSTTGPPARFASIRRVWMHSNTITLAGSSSSAQARQQLCQMAPTDVVIGVNPPSWAREAGNRDLAFRAYSSARQSSRLMDALDEVKSCGAAIHFMTWLTPRRRWCDGLVDTLFDLCARSGARSILLDAEETWTKVKPETGSHEGFARKIFGPMISGRPCAIGVTHIVARSLFPKIAPLIGVCDYHLPQAYSRGSPGKLQREAVSVWRDPNKPFVMGLSAIKGRVSTSDMWTDLRQTDALGIGEVYYWSFGHLRTRESRGRAEVVRRASDLARANRPGLPPPQLSHIPWPLF
ncbi:hypothetical protein [Salipiger mangrovisoli]|uniref:Beta protein n=1 Tax=Salipiger mangrovisoli TaxID=2865933 RepID=A0ABR9X127_9RHOB|nr:hypothetical protein [Salipiger mangrovisoli]MBE9637264.1 hypothetical protein [Salipiger mangrovisoli]